MANKITTTRKYSKEQMITYLEKHGSTLTEASNIAGTNPRTLNRYLAKGIIPSEWLMKIQAALKDRKPVKKEPRQTIYICGACGKEFTYTEGKDKLHATNAVGLKNLGVEKIPTSGYHWKNIFGKRERMFNVCSACHEKQMKKQRKEAPAKRKAAIESAKSAKKSK